MEKELLEKIYASQVVIYKRLVELEKKVEGGMISRPHKGHARELEKEIEKLKSQIEG